MSRIEALCVSEQKGEKKTPLQSAVFLKKIGIQGDAHAGEWHRQISLLALEDIDSVRQNQTVEIETGSFAENAIVSGLNFAAIGLGTRLRLGTEVVLSITQIGKVCHSRCRIYDLTGDCIMPRCGLFARVLEGGTVNVHDSVETVRLVPRERFQAVVLTVSDRGWRGETEDTAGPAVASRLEKALDAHVYTRRIVPDDLTIIESKLKHYSDGHSIDLIVTVGGTGFSPRDVTPEAARLVIERFTPGLDEAMRSASLQKTPHAMLSRGVSGIRRSTLIVNLPGSERAAVENLDAILGALDHGLKKLRGDTRDCGRPES